MKNNLKMTLATGLTFFVLAGCGFSAVSSAEGPVSAATSTSLPAEQLPTVSERDASGDYEASEAVTLSPEEDLSFLNEQERHYDLRDPSDTRLSEELVAPDVEETALKRIRYENLHKAISTLPSVQSRRLSLYFFGGFTLEEIARQEGVSTQSIGRSIYKAEKNLKKILIGG